MNKLPARTLAILLFAVLAIAFITMMTYYPSTRNSFVWDTNAYLLINEFWISKLTPYHLIWMMSSLEVFNWHPLTWLSWALDFQLYGGLNPWGYHLSNNILHTINSILVFALTLVVFGLNGPASKDYPLLTDNNALIAAFLAALIFAVHPQHVESVAWVAERKDLLCQLFLLLSMLAYVKYISCHESLKSRWFRGTLTLFVMALLSKPMAVTFPVVLLLIDVYPLRRTNFTQAVNLHVRQQSLYKLLREKLPFFLLSFLSILITLYAQRDALAEISFDLRVLNAFNSIIFYLTQLWLPIHFSPVYPYFLNIDEIITWKTFIPLFGVLGITLAALLAWKKDRHMWLVAWLFYLVTLSPVLGLVQAGLQGAADRYAYFSTLPVYLLIGAGILFVLNKSTTSIRLFLLLAVLPLVFLLADKTRQQIQVWENAQTLWSHTITLYPETYLAHMNLGGFYYNVHSYEKAAFHFKEAGRLNPTETKTIAWRGLTGLQLGRYEDAITFHAVLGSALDSIPGPNVDQHCIQYNIGWSYAQLGMYTESGELFSRVDPNSELGHDAGIWLNWLEGGKQSGGETPLIEGLPGFCSKLSSSK